MPMKTIRLLLTFACISFLAVTRAAPAPDLILHHGKILTVDKAFSIQQAIAIEGNRIMDVGPNDRILKLKSGRTQLIDLKGQTVLPGLMDSHTHPTSAAMTEFDHPIPDMASIADVLQYFRDRARVTKPGEWIVLQQVFITRLREQRYPTRAELDQGAPDHPAAFRTGPDASFNSLALKLSGIDRKFTLPQDIVGKVEKDASGEPTGILRNVSNYTRIPETGRTASKEEKAKRLVELFKDY